MSRRVLSIKVIAMNIGMAASVVVVGAVESSVIIVISAGITGFFGTGLLIEKIEAYYKEKDNEISMSNREDVFRARYPEIFNPDGSRK